MQQENPFLQNELPGMEPNPYRPLIDLLSNILEAYTTAFFLLDPKARRLNMVASQTLSKFLPESVSMPLEQSGILAQTQKVGQTIHLDKLQENTLNLSSTVPFYREGESHIKGVLVVPVGDGKGVLYVDTKYAWGFNDKQQKWIREVGDVLGHLLERHDCLAQQEGYAQLYDFWHRVDEAGFSDDALDAYCQTLVDECANFLKAEFGFLSIRDPDSPHFHTVAATPSVPRGLVNQNYAIGQGLIGWVFQNRKNLQITRLNPNTADHFLLVSTEAFPHQGTFWSLHGEMSLGQTVSLSFLTRQPCEWSSEEQYGVTHILEYSKLRLEHCCFSEECHQLRTYDLASGLLNGLAFESKVEAVVASSMQNSTPLVLALLQYEPWQILFTKVPPREVRRWQAEMVAALCKDLPPSVLVGQLAENRFGLLLPGMTAVEAEPHLAELAEKAQRVISSKVRGIRLLSYIGMAGFPQDGTRPDELWPMANNRLYASFRPTQSSEKSAKAGQ